MNLLEISVPTFKRVDSAIKCLKKLVQIREIYPNEISISCSSNQIESSLKNFCFENSIKYNEFNQNRGAHQNIKYILTNSSSKYCMILSDEDSINSQYMKSFLSFLKSLPNEVGIISTSIGKVDNEKNLFSYQDSYQKILFDREDYIYLNMFLPDYISGFTINNEFASNEIIEDSYEDTPDNAYAHKVFVLKALKKKKISVFSKNIVLMGQQVRKGGEAFAEINEPYNINQSQNKNLNIEVYGPKARLKQFAYLDQIISGLNLNSFLRNHAKLRNLFAFSMAIAKCHNDVHGIKRSDVKRLILESFNSDDFTYKKNNYQKIFILISSSPLILINIFNMLLYNYFRFTRYIYFKRLENKLLK